LDCPPSKDSKLASVGWWIVLVFGIAPVKGF